VGNISEIEKKGDSFMKKSDNTTPHKAEDYDTGVRKTIPYYETIHRETIDLIKAVKPDAKIWLDTGCGTGFTVEQAYPLFPQTHFIICDPAPKMLEKAKTRLQHKPKDGLTILEPMGSQELENKIKTKVDVITAIQAHLYLQRDERKKATENCFQLLNKSGIYVTTENIHPLTAKGVEIGLTRWTNFQLQAGRSKDDVEEHAQRFNKKYFPITIEEHLKLLRDTGFSTVEIFWYAQMQAGFYAIK
jgi:tRNA (cmo5U34)-methyltransferase